MFEDARVMSVFDEYRLRAEADRQRMRDLGPGGFAVRDEFLLPIGEDAARFMHALILARKPERLLEIGTSYGYSTLVLADAARAVGGKLITMEIAGYKQDYARNMLEKAGLADYVDLRCGDAVELINADPGPFDFVLVDLWKELYAPCFRAFYPKLSEEAVLCSDNMIEPVSAREDVREYREEVRAKPDMQTVLLPIGSGIELSIKWSAGNSKM